MVNNATENSCNTRQAMERGGVLWFTGLSGSGKSTISVALATELVRRGYRATVLDGDIMRQGLCSDLGFSVEDRAENLRRLAHVAKLVASLDIICITATISPLHKDRVRVRKIVGKQFREVYIAAELQTCEARDPKGLYKKARAGLIADFTGISSPYDTPENPDFVVQTKDVAVADSLALVLAYCLDTFSL